MDMTDEFLIEIGKQISYLREKNNQTLDDLEYLSGIDLSDINKYEKEYSSKFKIDGIPIYAIGISFNSTKRNIRNYKFTQL